MNTSHTKAHVVDHAPWRAVPKAGSRLGVSQIVNSLGGLIAECDYPGKAQLMATAPEMLKALKMARNCQLPLEVMSAVNAAIDKAGA